MNRRDVLKTVAGTATAGTLGVLGTGTAAAAPSMDAAFLVDDCDLNLYQHRDQAKYSVTDNTTFHVYQAVDTGGDSTTHDNTDGDAYAVAYDHDTGNVTGPYRIGLNPLVAEDTHGVPSLTIDGNGYVHVFFGNHGGWSIHLGGSEYQAIQYARSENPYDISSWIYPPNGSSGSGPLPMPEGTYMCATYNPDEGAVYVLYRKGKNMVHNYAVLARSADGGATWTNVNNDIMDFTGGPGDHNDAYVSDLGAWQGRIHMTWTIAEDHGGGHSDSRRNIYHAAYNPSTGNVENMSGVDLGTTITWSDAQNYCLVKDTGDIGLDRGDSVRGFNHAYDAASDTAYIPARYPLDASTSQLRVMSYSGVSTQSGSWQESSRITTTSSPNTLSVALRVNDSGQVEVTDQNGDNGLWRKESGTWNHYDYVAGTPEIGKVQRPVQNGPDDFGWYGRAMATDAEGDAWRSVYALGFGQPTGAGATPTRAPRNLRITSTGSTSATVDWDDGMAGTSGVSRYKVYVDGSHQKDVTTEPSGQPYPHTWTTIDFGSEGSYDVEVSLVNGNGTESATSNAVTVDTTGGNQAPYGGTAWPIPGTIQAEDYDTGGQGTAYNDTTSGNSGGAYRSDDVDIETTQDSTGSYNLAWVEAGEWLEYTVDVGSDGTYDLDLRVASPNTTGQLHVEINGTDMTGPVDVPNTGAWQTWTTVTVTGIGLTAGQRIMRVYIDGGGFNLNYLDWTEVTASSDLTVTVNGSTQTFSDGDIASYSGTQDQGTATIEESGDALRLANNTWKYVPLTHTVTADTVLEFELETPDEGEIVAIGFDNDNDHDNTIDGSYTLFQLAGSESWSNLVDLRSSFTPPDPQTVSIDVGSHYTTAADRLAFVADDDADASGEAVFRNIDVYEDAATTNLLANPGFENGTTSWTVRGTGGSLSTVSSPVNGGSAAAAVTSRSNPWNGPEQDVTNDLANNGQGTYDYDAYVRLGSGTGNAKVTVHVNDDDGDAYYYDPSVAVDDTGWTRITGLLDLSWSGLNSASFYVETDSTLADLYVDDTSLTY